MGGQICSEGRGINVMLSVIKHEDGPAAYDPMAASLAAAEEQSMEEKLAAAALITAAGRTERDGPVDLGKERYDFGIGDDCREDRARSFLPATSMQQQYESREQSVQDPPGIASVVHRASGTIRRVVTIRNPGGLEKQERLRDVVRRIQSFRCDGVARVLDVYEDFRSTSLVMENCSGGTVYDRILSKQYFAEQETAVLIRHMLQSLAYLHRHGLAHGHPSPDSFRFHTDAPQASLKLVDFGLELKVFLWDALQTVDGDGPMRGKGRATCLQFFETCKMAFSAPEIAKPLHGRRRAKCNEHGVGLDAGMLGGGAFDGELLAEAIDALLERSEDLNPRLLKAADVWSVGAIAFLLLCGYPPFFAPCRLSILQRIAKTDYAFDPPFWSKISEEAKDFVQGLLRPEAANRMSISEALRHPWIQNLADTSPSGSMLSSFALNLRRFYRTALIEVFAANSLAAKLSYAELCELQVACQETDAQRTGFFTASDLRQVLLRLGHNDIADAIAMCFSRTLRHPGESYIDYTSIVESVRARRERLLEEQLWTCFCDFAEAEGSAEEGATSVRTHGRLPASRVLAYLQESEVQRALERDGLEDSTAVATAVYASMRHGVEGISSACTADAYSSSLGGDGVANSPEVDFIDIASEIVRQLPPMAPDLAPPSTPQRGDR